MRPSAHVVHHGGVMNVLDGVLWIALGLLLILLHPHYWAASSFSDYLTVALGSLVYFALVGGQVELHTRLIGNCGKLERLEKISFFLVVLGALAAAVSNVAADGFHIPLIGWVFIVSLSILCLGLVLLAVVTLRANILPHWCSWVLLVGLLGFFLNNHPLPDGVGLILFGLTWIVLGYAIWKDQIRPLAPSKLVNH